jgi:hypothetical protein
MGIYVGQMGLRCTVSTEASEIKRYVYSLCVLAILNICLQVVWVVDMIFQAKQTLRNEAAKAAAKEEEDEPYKEGGQYFDDMDTDDDVHISDRSYMIYVSIQVSK